MKRTKKTASAANKPPLRAESPGRASGLRETEEARALLQDQLHNLYWWIFNAFRIKGFIRAKGLDDAATEGETLTAEEDEFGEAIASPKE
jgi:hypothetical protein